MTGPRAGFTLVELLVALALGLALSLAAVAAVATALRHAAGVALRAETDDIAELALEAFTLDVRRASFDPRAAGIEPVLEARTTRLVLQTDVDGDGTIDAASEELVTIACDLPGGRLSRIVGTQSLPLANGVVACALAYADATGAGIAVPPTGLDAPTRQRVRRAMLDLALVPPGSSAPTTARTTVALRVQP
jgi:prepilin-type N-terminal cleavage/methylation domain-containing protein